MSTRTPYFYIIRFKPDGRKYAGSKWGVGCSPEKLMTERGYKTSSTAIHRLIKSHGIDAFEVVSTKTEDECGMNVRDFESKFLIENDCASSSEWINSHNNVTRMNFGTDDYYKSMEKLYGVSNASQSKEFVQKKRATWLKKYGVENPSSLSSVKQRFVETSIENHGVTNPMKSPEIAERYKASCMAKYGTSNPLLALSVMQKRRETMMRKYGVPSYTQTAEFQEKKRLSMALKKAAA